MATAIVGRQKLRRTSRPRGQAQAIAVCALTVSILHILAAAAEVLHWRHVAIAALTELGLAIVYLRVYHEEHEQHRQEAESSSSPRSAGRLIVSNDQHKESSGTHRASVESSPYSEYEMAVEAFVSEGNPNLE